MTQSSSVASTQANSPRFFVLASAILASAMGFIDGSIVAIALPQMRVALDASFVEAQWIASSYVLMLSALIMLGGSLGDRIGVRRAFSFGVVIFVIASLACAVAQTSEQLILFRALKGIGAAVMIPGSMSLIAVNVPRAERGAAMGIWIAASSITTACGPLLGGLLLTYGDNSAWRWIFAINLPLGAAVLVMLYTKVRDDHVETGEPKAPVDWAGIVLSVASLGLLAGGLTALGESDAGGLAVAMICAGLVLVAVTVVVQLKLRHPIIPVQLFANRAFAGANLFTLLAWMPIAAVVFFLPMVLIVGWQLPPSYAGAMFLPMSALIAIFSPLAGRMADRVGTLPMLVSGGVVLGLSSLALAAAVFYQQFWLGILPSLALLGVGMGLAASPMSTAIMNSVDDSQVGSASGINNMVARMANLFAIAGLGALVAYVYALIVRAGSVPEIVRDGLLETGFGERLTGGLYVEPAVRLQKVAMDHAMIALCLALAVLCVIASLIAWASLPKSGKEEREAEAG